MQIADNGNNEPEKRAEKMMDAHTTVAHGAEADEGPGATELEAPPARLGHSLLDVLMPATPPEPKNARVIRLFDYEGAREAPQPATVQTRTREATPRETAKAARKLSLFAAAGLD